MKNVVSSLNTVDGQIIFEYDIPRLGKRIDVVLLYRGVVFCLEFKVCESKILETNIDQVLDYALDLNNFHKFSENKVIAPILVATNYSNRSTSIQMSVYDDRVNSYGGHAIGVYNGDTNKVHKMMRDNRIKYYAEADYSENSDIDKLVKAIIDRTATNEVLENAHYECKNQTEKFDKQNSEEEIQKMNLIIALEGSGSFARTHSIIAELAKHKWNGEERETLFNIAVENSQIFYILEDEDVKRFYKSLLKGSRSTSENAQKIREILG